MVGADQIARVDVGLVDELVDFDRARGLQRDLLELLPQDLDVLALLELIALDDVLVGDLFALSASTLTYLSRWPVVRFS